MRILMINKFLYPKGGAETYTLSLANILTNNGHEVEYFGLRNEKNTVGNSCDALVNDMDFSQGIKKNIFAPFRIIYNKQARKQIRKVLNHFEPDIVHLNNIQYHLTPSIILEINKWRIKNKKDCKIIYTAHDYQLICPSHGLFDKDVKPCELCLDGKYRHCFQTKCLKNSRLKSLLGTIDGYYWKHSKAYSYVDSIICCSKFLKDKLDTQERFKNKTIALHNFKDIDKVNDINKKDYILEFGKLCKDKGTDTLLEVAKLLPNEKFLFVGYGPSVDKIKKVENCEYLGFKTGEELNRLIAEAKLTICGSEMYENCPFSVIESISYGTPVIGTTMGGIPELINDGYNGLLYSPGNVEQLKKCIEDISLKKDEYSSNCLLSSFETSKTYYDKLMKIYKGEYHA